MLTILDRYIICHVLRTTFAVWLGLVLLFSALQWIGELRSIAGDYQLIDTLWHTLLTMARRAYRLFPFVALGSALWAVSGLAAREELVVMRANGLSRVRLVKPVLIAIAGLLVLSIMGGELSGDHLEPKARNFRIGKITGTLSLANIEGLWLRDGESIIHILRPLMRPEGGTDFRRLRFFDAKDGRLCEWSEAARGEHFKDEWRLEGVTQVNLCEEPIERIYLAESRWPSSLPPDLLANVALRPTLLPIKELYAYVNFLEANQLEAYRYKIAFYQRLYVAPNVLLLVWLALPFVLATSRQLSRGKRVAIGLSVGVGSFILHQMVESVTGVYQLNPAISTALPVLLSFFIGLVIYHSSN